MTTPLTAAMAELTKTANCKVTFTTSLNSYEQTKIGSETGTLVVKARLVQALAESIMNKNLISIIKQPKMPDTDSISYSATLFVLTPERFEYMLNEVYCLGARNK